MSYKYDGNHIRVGKTGGTMYWRDVNGNTIAETDLGGMGVNEYIFFAGRRLARIDSSGTIYYYQTDQIGSTRSGTTSIGALFGDANKGTAGLLVGAGGAAAPIGAGTAGTFGRRTATIFDLNLSGTTGPAPTILGKTGAKEAIGWVSGFFEVKLAADIGATAAEALNCIGHR